MLAETATDQNRELLSYMIASGDMRFIEISERALFLRLDSGLGLVIRGEVPECGPDCYANLSQVLLEYVMGCEDCRDAERTPAVVDQFGQRLGQEFIDLRYQEPAPGHGVEQLVDALTILLKSLDVPFVLHRSADLLQFKLAYCPLQSTADKAGLKLWVALAHRTLFALIETVARSLAPEWVLESPSERQTNTPLRLIRIAKASPTA